MLAASISVASGFEAENAAALFQDSFSELPPLNALFKSFLNVFDPQFLDLSCQEVGKPRLSWANDLGI